VPKPPPQRAHQIQRLAGTGSGELPGPPARDAVEKAERILLGPVDAERAAQERVPALTGAAEDRDELSGLRVPEAAHPGEEHLPVPGSHLAVVEDLQTV